jgi:MbtH protein
MDSDNTTLAAEKPALIQTQPSFQISISTDMPKEYINPFDDTSHLFHLLINDRQQHSLWPAFATIPAGWQSIFGPVQREACVTYLEQQPHI